MIAGHHARAEEVENADGCAFTGDVIDGVVVNVEGAAAGGVNSAQIDVLDGDVIDFQVVELDAQAMVGDDSVAGLDVLAVADHAAGEIRIVAVECDEIDVHLRRFDRDHAAGADAQRRPGGNIRADDGRVEDNPRLRLTPQSQRLINYDIAAIAAVLNLDD